MERLKTDVAIIGGGPAGTTVGSLLRKYNPELRVTIIEREQFPRDHVGESQLPAITQILDEMGAWEKVESAGFPIKLGGTYRWGTTDDLWHLDFIQTKDFVKKPRPAPLDSQRRETAFQVDRSIYDTILLDHAKALGCETKMETRVESVESASGYVTRLVVRPKDGEPYEVKARYYVDASGERGVLREAVGVKSEMPTSLRNIAFWDYWQHAEWAETFEDVATRIQVMSLGWGWIWFIPITPTRTSVGLVVPADYYKASNKRPEDLYLEALAVEPRIAKLLGKATREHRFDATKDWNFLASQLAGENWFLVGDSCGFADPILSAGMTLAHTSGRKVAYSILELYRGRHRPEWIRSEYSDQHRAQIQHHMRFAEFWYAGNGCFTDLKAFCSEIAESVGLELEPDQAFAWLGTGGFALEHPGLARALGYPIAGLKLVSDRLTGGQTRSHLTGNNVVQANLEGSEAVPYAFYERGQIFVAMSYLRGGVQLPYGGLFLLLMQYMAEPVEVDKLLKVCLAEALKKKILTDQSEGRHLVEALEALIIEGWAVARFDPSFPPSQVTEVALAHLA